MNGLAIVHDRTSEWRRLKALVLLMRGAGYLLERLMFKLLKLAYWDEWESRGVPVGTDAGATHHWHVRFGI